MTRSADAYSVTSALALFALTALAIGIVWWWLGAPVKLPPSPLAAGQKLSCVSYAPFRDGQDPLVETTQVEPAQIDADLALLSKYTDCVRTYSVANGLDKIAGIAQRHGLKVLQGLWLSSDAEKNRQQIATVVALAKQFPETISAIVVGNEVLLRGEMSATDLMATIREVKAQVPEPVTYADVWEFWLRYRDVANAVDFVTIHILPYWEDFPLPARLAAAHVELDPHAGLPPPSRNREIVIGEVGWPSAGRMREGALPSPSNQALVIEQTLALAQRENFRVNVIEAFDQSWKRWLEGSVGGHWGIFDRSDWRAQVRSRRRRGVRSSAMAAAGACRHLVCRRDLWLRFRGRADKIGATLVLAEDCRAYIPSSRSARRDDREHSARKLHGGHLAALARLHRCCRRSADRVRNGCRYEFAAADICRASWPPGRAAWSSELGAHRRVYCSCIASGRERARPCASTHAIGISRLRPCAAQ